MDARVPMASILTAFGLPITVTRPSPDDTPVTTTGVWLPIPIDEKRPIGTDFQRAEPRKVLSIPRDRVVKNVPRGSTVLAAEYAGGPVKTWRVDGYDGPTEADLLHVRLVVMADCT